MLPEGALTFLHNSAGTVRCGNGCLIPITHFRVGFWSIKRKVVKSKVHQIILSIKMIKFFSPKKRLRYVHIISRTRFFHVRLQLSVGSLEMKGGALF
jgi:hypothetical protein